jgi:PAS domain S-box-containing protein
MKLLHIAPDRDAALVPLAVAQRIAPDATLSWVATADAALHWLHANRDAAAVILEAHAQGQASFVAQLRGMGLTTPIIVVAGSAGPEPALAALNSGADGYLVAGPSLAADLPRSVTAAIQSERSRRRLVEEMLSELGVQRGRSGGQLARAEEEARRQSEERSARVLAAAAARLAEVEARQSVSLARETRIGVALQQRLLELESALAKADERRASEAVSFAAQLAKRHAEFTASLAQAAHSRDALAAELNLATAALDAERQARQDDAAAAAEQLRRREAEFRAELAEAATGRAALDKALADAEAAHQETRQRAAIDLAGANERQSALEDLLAQESDRRTTLERRLSACETAYQETERRHLAATGKATAELLELQSRYDAALQDGAAIRAALAQQTADAAATRTALERRVSEAQSAHLQATRCAEENLTAAAARQLVLEERLAQEMARNIRRDRQLAAAEAARQEAEERRASELAAANARLDSLQRSHDAAADEHAAVIAQLHQQLTDARTMYRDAEERTAAALAAASTRETELAERLVQESDARGAVEREFAGMRREAARARRRSLHVAAAYRQAMRERTAEIEAQLHTTRNQLEQLQHLVEEQRQAHELARSTSDDELQRLSAEHGQICQSFDRLQSAFQTLERIAGEHAAERSRLAEVVAERDSQLSAQAERYRVAEHNAQRALAELQERHRNALDANGAEVARLQQAIDAARRELDASRTHAEALRGVAERVPDLQALLDRTLNERRRQFERAPYALCRCSENGAITDANHSFAALLGYRRPEDLRNKDFAAAAHDSAGDLGWLLERAKTTRKSETVETQWKTRDGRRLVVRLQALATGADAIEIVAEDITEARALEERLRQAQRMEAVGRLAAEVAVTCDAMLSDVARGADEWVARAGSDAVTKRHAERLLTDVMRATSFLRQLGTYSNEQVRALEPVSVQRVLRDLAPVLKRLVGDPIDLVLPKSGAPFNVDVDAERLERVLINVAGYARQRMPFGGQVRIDLATASVGRRFVARYANVRPGEHVLITVTELPAPAELRADPSRGSRASDRPGVDLGVLVDLVASCGGHLWLEAQPAGNMVVKIHLPKPPAAASEPRGGRLSRLFRMTPALSA